ncbi:MAG: hypothetical protein ACOC56_04475 [Atribacterota bacterium]
MWKLESYEETQKKLMGFKKLKRDLELEFCVDEYNRVIDRIKGLITNTFLFLYAGECYDLKVSGLHSITTITVCNMRDEYKIETDKLYQIYIISQKEATKILDDMIDEFIRKIKTENIENLYYTDMTMNEYGLVLNYLNKIEKIGNLTINPCQNGISIVKGGK